MKKNNKWEEKLQPNLDKKEIMIRRALTIFGLLVILAALATLVYALRLKQYSIAFVCISCLILMALSWLKLNPKLHNTIRLSTKIIPLKRNFNLVNFLNIILNTKTPYGPPKVGFRIENIYLGVPAYILNDCGSLIYFYIKNDTIIFKIRRYRKPGSPEQCYEDDHIVNVFQDKLIDYFCFVINEKRKPNKEEMDRLFENIPKPKIDGTIQ